MARAMPTIAVQAPLVLTIPDLDGAGPGHWLSRWEAEDDALRRVDMVDWAEPNRNRWVNRLNLAIHRAGRPVLLVAHGIGCLTVAWWAHYELPNWGDPVIGALLIAPPDVDAPAADPRNQVFRPTPLGPLPFASLLVSRRDEAPARVARLASFWGSELVAGADVGGGAGVSERDLLARLAQAAERRAAPPVEPAREPGAFSF